MFAPGWSLAEGAPVATVSCVPDKKKKVEK